MTSEDYIKQLEEENKRLRKATSPICVGPPLVSILAKEGAWLSQDGQSIIAADGLFRQDPYVEIKELKLSRDAYRARCNAFKKLLSDCKKEIGCPASRSFFRFVRELAGTDVLKGAPVCRVCGGRMKLGRAIIPGIYASEDFGGDFGQAGTTMSEGPATKGPVECLKCEKCGHSFLPKNAPVMPRPTTTNQ